VDHARQVRAFRAALASAGLPNRLPDAAGAEAAAAVFRAERPGVRVALRSAIDRLLQAWRVEGLHDGLELEAWLAVANGCDDDPFRREVRGRALPMYWANGSNARIDTSELYRLAERATAAKAPADAVVLIAATIINVSRDAESDPRLTGVLSAARDRAPNDPELQAIYADHMSGLWQMNHDPRTFAEALGGYRARIALRPNDPLALFALAYLLQHHGDYAEAAAGFHAALARNPKLNFARVNLSVCLKARGDMEGAVAVLREAVQLDARFRMGHVSLGWALHLKGDLDGAVAEHKEALRLNPRSADSHSYLAWDLQDKGDLDGAVAEYKEALRINPREKVAVDDLPRAERMRSVLPRLAGVLAGTDRPASPAEACDCARLCRLQFQKRFATAVRLYEQAFAEAPKLAGDLAAGHRYAAATSAARAARGDGVDAPAGASARAALRAKALGWLRADLALCQKQAASLDATERRTAGDMLTDWLKELDLVHVREEASLASLPADEADRWRAFWADVKATIAQPLAPSPPPQGKE
jgi:tetratricopeptide (TPR) repeat protein